MTLGLFCFPEAVRGTHPSSSHGLRSAAAAAAAASVPPPAAAVAVEKEAPNGTRDMAGLLRGRYAGSRGEVYEYRIHE